MFCESLETRRFLTVTLRPPIPPGPSGDPGTLPPECIDVVQDNAGKVTIDMLSGSAGGSPCTMDVSVFEDNGTLVVTETATGATWDVTGATEVVIKDSKRDDNIFYTGNSIGADISGGTGNDSITVADTGTGSSYVDAGKGNDSINLLVGNATTIKAQSGADTIYVNSGGGIYVTATASAYIYAGGGDDVIVTYDGTNTINGDGGTDVVLEFGGTNTVTSATVETP